MDRQTQAVWHSYRDRGYSLLAVGIRHRGTELPLICERGDELVVVVPGLDPPPPERAQQLREALEAYLIARKVSDRYLRFDGAWIENGRVTLRKDLIPVFGPHVTSSQGPESRT